MNTRVGVIGTGYWGASWVPVILENAHTELSGIFGRSDQSLVPIQATHGLSDRQLFTDLDLFLAAGHDIVIVTVHHHQGLHRIIGEKVIDSGARLLIEKPIAENLEDAEALVRLARERGVEVVVGQNFRYHANVLAVKDWLKREMIGELLGVDVQMRGWFPPDMPAWRLEQPYPHLVELGVHSLDLIRFLFEEEAAAVTARSANFERSHFRSASMTNATIELTSGILVNWTGNTETRVRYTNVTGEWWIYGRDGVIQLQNEDAWCYRPNGDVVEVAEGVLGISTLTSGRDRLLEAWIQGIRSGTTVSHTGEDNLGTMRLLFALIESSESGRSVPVGN